ncbi:MAG: hypothetical protein M3O30_03880 [Planctomycetota bacterium]|nr:hypothetical protein [Planctomycetota bacterium]
MDQHPETSKSLYAGVSLVSLATIVFEIVLTRLFSVTMWNHFAFVAVSIAMFGMTVGSVSVYLLEKWITPPRTRAWMAWSALLFGITAIIALHAHLALRVKPELTGATLPLLLCTYAIASVPFVMSGVCISLALTRFPTSVSRLYSADLTGAGIGCLFLILMLRISDGPTVVYAVGVTAAAAGYFFADGSLSRWASRCSIVAAVGLALFTGINVYYIQNHAGRGLIQMTWTKGGDQPSDVLWERWNSYSRVQIYGYGEFGKPLSWGRSPSAPPAPLIPRREIEIDASADTPLTGFDGNLPEHSYLAWDVTNIAHAVQRDADVMVVGAGGGRDLLSALYFNQKSVLGIELNSSIYDAMEGPFAEYSGNLAFLPRVRLVNDEARSYITRSAGQIDLLEISLVDTWAATAAGAFVLSENGLYTVNAWKLFLSHLNPGGILSVTRWYKPADLTMTYRLVAMANAALRDRGVTQPRRHIALVANGPDAVLRTLSEWRCMCTILVCRDPFTPEQLSRLHDACALRGFEVILDPATSLNPQLAMVAQADDMEQAAGMLSPAVIPPTDDKPFFFQTDSLGDLFHAAGWRRTAGGSGIFLIAGLFVFVVVLSLLFIVLPVALKSAPDPSGSFLALTVYFTFIGGGFMTIEISLLQRLVLLLGHPAYSLNTVLFTLLIFSGIGSLLTAPVNVDSVRRSMSARWVLLIFILVATGLAVGPVVRLLAGSITPVRIAAAVMLLAPLGLCMGMAFPLGMKWAQQCNASYSAWLWGVNGAASVCASVFTVIISLTEGIPTAWWMGVAFYLAAALAVFTSSRRPRHDFEPAPPSADSPN